MFGSTDTQFIMHTFKYVPWGIVLKVKQFMLSFSIGNTLVRQEMDKFVHF